MTTETKLIRVKSQTHRKLKILMAKMGLNTFDGIINILINK